MRALVVLALAFPLLSQPEAPPALPIPEDTQNMLAGAKLDALGAQRLEAALLTHPNGRPEHLALLGYYYWSRGAGWQENAGRHVYWFIRHDPASPALLVAPMIRPLSAHLQQDIDQAWNDAAANNEQNKAVLKNAATFLEMSDPRRAAELWKKIIALEPSCSTCREALGASYAWMIYGVHGSDDAGRPVFIKADDATRQSAAEARKALEQTQDARVLVTAGWTLNGYTSQYQEQTKRDPGELIAFGAQLRDRGYALDPLLPRPGGMPLGTAQWLPNSAPPPRSRRIIVDMATQASRLVEQVAPAHPALAHQAHVAGIVRFQIVVSTDGHVLSAQLIQGHPLLIEAARDAISQWRYRHVTVNGEPVEVLTTADVKFADELQGGAK